MPSPRTRSRQSNGGRTKRRYVRLTEAEDRALQAKADAAGWTVPRLMVEGGQGWSPEQLEALRTDLDSVRWWLARINPNVNQIAHLLNSEKVPSWAAIEAMPGEVRSAIARLDSVLARLGG